MFAQAIEDLLQTHCTPAHVRAIEHGASCQPLASALEDAGFFALLAPEAQGGGDASWRDLHDIVRLAGVWSVPLPLAQTLALRALVEDPQCLPAGAITFASVLRREADGGLLAAQVPAARAAAHVVGVLDGAWVLLPVADDQAQASGVHGSQAASLRWPAGTVPRALKARLPAERLQSIAALLHAGLLAGALQRAFDLTMAYANDREQFGKSIGKFQAIQHQLAVMAEQVAAAGMACEAAFAAAPDGDAPPPAACAVAKARSSEAAAQVAAIAHALHGAIGVTEEYDLQLSTRRLHEWRMAHGSEAYWHRELGRQLIESEHPTVTDFVRTLL
ncbi:acyl-CoA dehydrogenase family protein [Hydrogenophaga sp. BPS33]|uniref:acyl-CoA dehydrogenase family protein n=1 Tax=Hydrogenophaga sp. BPS33 TaxID=2651974 RepID=UPI00131F9B34|nr:acyl-CoA dehydrogenase family protein [Hydrogenophaga sp. BPS33]QHE85561.1 acyl-CoA dehydrogenase [Hydrogenophaga sp. BPS33]